MRSTSPLVACLIALVAGCGGQRTSAARRPRGVVSGAGGVPIAYDVRGHGTPAVVLVHGWACDRSYLAAQMAPLSLRYTVVAVDLGGHGESGLGRTTWTIESFGEDVAAVVETLGLERVILVGHSMGGDVVVAAARRLPGRVAGLVSIDTYRKLGPGRTPEQVNAFVAPFRKDFAGTTRGFVRGMFLPTSDPALVDRIAADMSSAPPEVALAAIESSFGYSREVTKALDELKLPVVALNPDDGPTDVASLERHGVKVVIVPGADHFVPVEAPERLNPLLESAIASLAR